MTVAFAFHRIVPLCTFLVLLPPSSSAQVTFTVNTSGDAADTGPNGVCDSDATTPGDQCTLRAALQETEATAAVDSIHFDIPGAGVHTITVATALPVLFAPVVIDGYTQPGASVNTNGPAQGTNAVLRIELVNDGAVGRGLVLCFGDKTVRGLAVGGFTDAGISIDCNGGTVGHVVEGCFIGTDAAGSVARPNGGNAVSIASASGNRIGGTSPAARNVLSASGLSGVGIGSAGTGQPSVNNVIQGNLIGTDASGTVALPNGTAFPGQLAGVTLSPNQGSMAGNVIGGTVPGARNVISGNVGAGLRLGGAVDFTGTRIEGNFIGTDVTGTVAMANTGPGIEISAAGVAIGGTAAGAGNVIAHNGGAGVSMPGLATAVRVLGNSMHDNTGLGIELGFPDGLPLPNDPGDPDVGANLRQNTPVLDAVGLSGAGAIVATYRVDTDPANATYPLRIEFFVADGGGEGAYFLGSDSYSLTDHAGCGTPPCPKVATFTPAAPVAAGDDFVATATDDAGNTGEFTETPAIVVAGEGPAAPAGVRLHSPEPNPAQASTLLRYELDVASPVRLTVHDVIGRQVALVADGVRPAGRHEAALDAARLAPGVYVLRLRTSEATVDRVLTVVR